MSVPLKSKVLNDLQGYPYKFYRGGAFNNIATGCYFCSCFDIAKSYGDIVIETEIAVKFPLVIDATLTNGYSYYEQIDIRKCVLSPENKRAELMKYMEEIGARHYLSTDEILAWAKATPGIDAVIVKNIREGINSNFPIYDIMIWDESVLLNTWDITNQDAIFSAFRKNTYKRVDLSAYINEFEQDKVVNIIRQAKYSVEHHMRRNSTCWYLSHNLVVHTDCPVEISAPSLDLIPADLISPGKYQWNPSASVREKFIPYNGILSISNLPDVFAYLEYKIIL